MFLFCLFIIQPWFYPVVKYCFNATCFIRFIFVNSVIVSSNISCNDLTWDFIIMCLVFCQLKFSICVRCDMAFIEPMHRNKPNITYLLRYNKKFTMRDLKRSLKKSNNSSPGPDQIHYEILRHLPIETLHILLDIINETWKSDTFPESWREALIISIPKPGKDHFNPLNYRPIALTSCMGTVVGGLLAWCPWGWHQLEVTPMGIRRPRYIWSSSTSNPPKCCYFVVVGGLACLADPRGYASWSFDSW